MNICSYCYEKKYYNGHTNQLRSQTNNSKTSEMQIMMVYHNKQFKDVRYADYDGLRYYQHLKLNTPIFHLFPFYYEDNSRITLKTQRMEIHIKVKAPILEWEINFMCGKIDHA